MALLRLLTLNIAHGRGLGLYQGFASRRELRRNLSRIAAYLVRHRVDVAALQEVDELSHWNGGLNLLDILREEAGFPYAEMGVNNRRLGRRPLAYGNAILSRHPLHGSEATAFGRATLGEKGFLFTLVEVGGGHVPLINLHLDYRSRRQRLVQIERVIAYAQDKARESRGPTWLSLPVFCGDFNASWHQHGDAVRRLLDYMLGSAQYSLYPRSGHTFPAHFPRRGLDFILLPEPLRCVHCEVARTYLSDHRPVLLDFEAPESV